MSELPVLPNEVRATMLPEVAVYVGALETAVAALREQVAVLTARIQQNSTNSSRPPSSDPPSLRAGGGNQAGTRQPGGQPGHPGHFRQRCAPAAVTTVQQCIPIACGRCGQGLTAQAAPTDPPVVCHQVTELPRLAATVTEYQLAGRRCANCGHLTRAPLPAGVPTGAFGPVLLATLSLLTGRYRLSKREVADVSATVFGVPVAVGSVSASEATVSRALAPVMAAAEAAARTAPVANVDETGWREQRQRRYLWTMVTDRATVFHAGRRRSGQALDDLLGEEWTGIVGSDRYGAYKRLPLARRQVCWAHARRDFQALVDAGPASRPIGERLVAITAHLFELWHRHQAGELDRDAVVALMGRTAAEMAAVLAVGRDRGQPGNVQRCCREYQALWPALWTFVHAPGVEPTNNRAERALRPAVLWRKGSFGTHSPAGSQFVERLLTVAATARQHGRDLLTLLIDALTAAHHGSAPPALIPALNP